MSIVAMMRVTVCGLTRDKDGLLRALQDLGCMHLVSLRPPPKEPEKAPSPRAEDAYKALRYLTDIKTPRRQVTDIREFELSEVVQRALQNQQRRRQLEDRRDVLRARIRELEPWGDFRFPAQEALRGYRLWFYRVPHPMLVAWGNPPVPWQEVHRDNRFAYIVVVAKEEPPHAAFPVARTHTGAIPLRDLHRRLQVTEIELEDVYAEHYALSRWVYLISANLAQAEDSAALNHAQSLVLERDGIIAVQGWVPQRAVHKVEALAQTRGLALLAQLPSRADSPPTLMENPESVGGGQDLVSFYQTPGYHGWDPSRVVYFSFAVFFSMILADAGYALALMLVLGYFWRGMATSAQGRRLRVLGATVLACSFVYGVMVGSYFGARPAPDSVASHLAVLDLNNFAAMMQLSVVVGCLHLMLANLILARRAGRFPANGVPLGWTAMIAAGLLMFLAESGSIGTGWMDAAWLLLIAGVAMVLGFASQRPVTSLTAGLLRFLDGLRALTNVSKIFGDVLSYLRLFALGLASSSLAVTFNGLAVDVREAVPGLGLFLAILLLVLGHLINLGLGIMSGFVHGLRLNFIEFFNWGISEEGYPFRPFAKKEIGQ